MDRMEQDSESGMGLNDFLFTAYRHKLWIILFSLVGVTVAASMYYRGNLYEAEAKLLVRYVVDRSAIDASGAESPVQKTNFGAESIINSEMEILTSTDLALEVADNIPVNQLLPLGKREYDKAAAAKAIMDGLTVNPVKGSNIIVASFRHRDREMAITVLREMISRYLAKHLEVHRSVGTFEFLARQTDEIRSRLQRTEQDLTRVKEEAGVTSLKESKELVSSQIASVEQELADAEANRIEQRTRLKERGWSTSRPELPAKPLEPTSVDENIVQEYVSARNRLARLRENEGGLLSRYTAGSRFVRLNREQISELDRQCREMLRQYPGLSGLVSAGRTGGSGAQVEDPASEKARLAGIEARVDSLRSRLEVLQTNAAKIAKHEARISELERRKELEEGNYKYFESSLEQARIDEALDPSKMPNISVVQSPTVALRAPGKVRKLMIAILGGCTAAGFALAVFIDRFVAPTVKRPVEISGQMHMPLLLSVPRFRSRAKPTRSRGSPDGTHAAWDLANVIRPYCEALRDRIVLRFQLRELTRKPKLIAVAGCAEGAGTTTLAVGLAAAVSETGDGKVLLVDMNLGKTGMHPFFKGLPACTLADVISERRRGAAADDNLYVAQAGPNDAQGSQLVPKKFYELIPRLKASDFDYIIFDMPPLTEISATVALVGFMDHVLFVVEAEKSQRQSVKRAYSDLVSVRADVSVVLNKTRNGGPMCLQAA